MPTPENINILYDNVKKLILEARTSVARTVNYVTLIQNWEIGRMIVEEEQGGKAKAEYGKYIIKELAEKLTKEFGSSYNIINLKYFRQFFITYPIGHAMRDQLDNKEKVNAVRSQSESIDKKENTIRHALRSEFTDKIRNAVHSQSKN